MNILKKADQIVNERVEETERMYGDFGTCMERTAEIASVLTGKSISAEDTYLIMAAHKLAREFHSHKEDNLLDCVAYLGALNNYIEDE